jgi:hypothetical protein
MRWRCARRPAFPSGGRPNGRLEPLTLGASACCDEACVAKNLSDGRFLCPPTPHRVLERRLPMFAERRLGLFQRHRDSVDSIGEPDRQRF